MRHPLTPQVEARKAQVAELRGLVRDDPEAHLAQLAASLRGLAGLHRQGGEPSDAIAPAEEAVLHHRRLAQQEPQRFTAGLAAALLELGSCLVAADERERAWPVLEESLALLRPLLEAPQPPADLRAQAEPPGSWPSRLDLVDLMVELAEQLAAAWKPSAAALASGLAVEVMGALTAADPRLRPRLADVLEVHCRLLADDQ